MKLKIALSFCVCFLVSCDQESDFLGFGVLHFEENQSVHLEFYHDPSGSFSNMFSVDLYYDENRRGIISSLKSGVDTLEFHPLYQMSERSVLTLRVLRQKGDWYNVYTDEIKGLTHWLYAPARSLETWMEFLPTVHTVYTRDQKLNPLRDNPHNKAKIYPLSPESLCLSVAEVNGDWLKVKNTPGRCPNQYKLKQEFEGFMRWKRKKDILIYFTL